MKTKKPTVFLLKIQSCFLRRAGVLLGHALWKDLELGVGPKGLETRRKGSQHKEPDHLTLKPFVILHTELWAAFLLTYS